MIKQDKTHLNNYGNETPQQEISNELSLDSTFLEKGLTTPFPKENAKTIRTHHILNFIKEHPGTTAYEISKILEFSYSDVARIIRDLEYTQIVQVEMEYLDSVVKKRLYIPKIKILEEKQNVA